MQTNQATTIRDTSPDSDAAQPRILILLASFNGARHIREQLESILAQINVQLHIVIRDDGSTDGTRMELARFADDARIKVSTADVPSGSAAQNFLKLIAENPAGSYDYIAFADQDDHWHPDKLARACQMLSSTGAAGYSSATLAVWEDGRQHVLEPSGAPTASDYLFEGAGQGCTFVLTAALYERVRQFLLSHRQLTRSLHYHDWMVYALTRSWKLKWHLDPQPSMRYRQHEGNDTGARGTVGGVTRRLAKVRDGWYRTQLVTIADACAAAAPTDETVRTWQSQLKRPAALTRRLSLARLVLQGGRRRTRDNLILLLAALRGWI
jgi:rhamnosyltransferase